MIKHRAIATKISATFMGAALLATPLAAVSTSAFAQAAEEVNYSALLQEIENLKLNIAQQEMFVQTQANKIAALEGQVADTPAVTEAITPMLDKMAAAIEGEIKADIPFKLGERYARLDKLKADIADPEVRAGDKMRRALMIYDIEVGYGTSLEAYKANHPTNPGTRLAACEADLMSKECNLTKEMRESIDAGATLRAIRNDITDGDYLRYGRLALSYLHHDESEALRYDPMTKEWLPLNAGQMLELRRGLRTARGEAAPTVVNAPVYVTN